MPGFTDAIEHSPCLAAPAANTVICTTRPVSQLGDNQFRVKIETSLVSPGTELHRIQGTHTEKSSFPRATGYISVGRIVGAGIHATGAGMGQRVLLHQNHCAYHNADASRIMAVPEGVDSVDAASAVLLAIALRGIRGGKIRFGDSVVIFGLGVVGLFAVHLAKLAGAFPVIGVDPIALRRGVGATMGADLTIDPTTVDARQAVLDATAGEGARVSIDASGTPRVLATLPQLTAEFGQLVVLGGIHGTVAMDLYTHFQKRNQTLVGCGSPFPGDYPFDEHRNEQVLLSMIRAGVVRPRPVITHYVPWKHGPELYQKMMTEKDKVIGVAFDWNDA